MSKTASFPRIVDYWLGGPQNTPIDQEVGDALAARYPDAPALFRGQRHFQQRAVAAFHDAGIRQFLVFGAGLPTAGHVHEQLKDDKVYYSDTDFDVVQPGAGLLAGVRRRVRYQTLDARDGENLEDLEFSPVLNVEAPMGIVFIGAGEGYGDEDLKAVLTNLAQWAPAGSALAFTHAGPGGAHLKALFEEHGRAFTPRSQGDLGALLSGFTLDGEGLESLSGSVEGAPSFLLGAIGRKA